jgi:hypothetical protein
LANAGPKSTSGTWSSALPRIQAGADIAYRCMKPSDHMKRWYRLRKKKQTSTRPATPSV